MKIKDIMVKKFFTLDENELLLEAKKVFDKGKVHHILITKNDVLIGIISKADYLKVIQLIAKDSPRQDLINERLLTSVLCSEVMHTDLVTLDANEDLTTALDIFLKNEIHCLPIIEDGNAVGVLTPIDLLRYYTQK